MVPSISLHYTSIPVVVGQSQLRICYKETGAGSKVREISPFELEERQTELSL